MLEGVQVASGESLGRREADDWRFPGTIAWFLFPGGYGRVPERERWPGKPPGPPTLSLPAASRPRERVGEGAKRCPGGCCRVLDSFSSSPSLFLWSQRLDRGWAAANRQPFAKEKDGGEKEIRFYTRQASEEFLPPPPPVGPKPGRDMTLGPTKWAVRRRLETQACRGKNKILVSGC